MSKSSELGKLQQEIIKHFFTCSEKKETVSHISKHISSLQPAVFRSVASLMKQGYVVKEKDNKNVEKYLKLTPKGIAWAALSGTNLELLKTYVTQQAGHSSVLQLLVEVMRDADKKDLLLCRAAEYILKNKFVERNDLDTMNRINLLAILLADSVVRINQNLTLVELAKKFELDIEFIRKILINKKQHIELLLNELRSTAGAHKLSVNQIQVISDNGVSLEAEPELEKPLGPSPSEFSISIDEYVKSEIDRLWIERGELGLKYLKLSIAEGKLRNISVDLINFGQKSTVNSTNFVPIQTK